MGIRHSTRMSRIGGWLPIRYGKKWKIERRRVKKVEGVCLRMALAIPRRRIHTHAHTYWTGDPESVLSSSWLRSLMMLGYDLKVYLQLTLGFSSGGWGLSQSSSLDRRHPSHPWLSASQQRHTFAGGLSQANYSGV